MTGWVSRSYLQFDPSLAVVAVVSGRGRHHAFVSSWRFSGQTEFAPAFRLEGDMVHVTRSGLQRALEPIVDGGHKLIGCEIE